MMSGFPLLKHQIKLTVKHGLLHRGLRGIVSFSCTVAPSGQDTPHRPEVEWLRMQPCPWGPMVPGVLYGYWLYFLLKDVGAWGRLPPRSLRLVKLPAQTTNYFLPIICIFGTSIEWHVKSLYES